MHIIAGSKKGRRIVAPKDASVRPTSARLRAAVFNICQEFIVGARFLDLFAGSGAIGLEALSRGAKSCTFVESGKENTLVIKKNAQALELDAASHVVHADVFSFLKRKIDAASSFDLIFADPPYARERKGERGSQSYGHSVIELIDNSSLLAPGGYLFIEDETSEYLSELKNLKLISTRTSGRATLMQFQRGSSLS